MHPCAKGEKVLWRSERIPRRACELSLLQARTTIRGEEQEGGSAFKGCASTKQSRGGARAATRNHLADARRRGLSSRSAGVTLKRSLQRKWKNCSSVRAAASAGDSRRHALRCAAGSGPINPWSPAAWWRG